MALHSKLRKKISFSLQLELVGKKTVSPIAIAIATQSSPSLALSTRLFVI